MTLVSVGEEEGIIEKQEKELINSIFEFGDTIVKEVMVPRMDMIAVDKKADMEAVFQLILKEGVSRVPVYDKTIDNVVGIVYARDLLVMSAKHKNSSKTIQTLVKPAYYVPETKRVIELLTELQKAKVHMAIVVDEYGGTAGLVTIEDLLEEIVGEIFDEYDSEEVLIEKIDKENFRVNAKTDLDEINKQLNLDLPDAEYESIGGFVVNLFGKIPMPGEKIDHDSAVFTVEKVIRRRLSKILITKKEPAIKKDE
jgi:putative hemolysin